jgi:rubrerythrin
MVLCLGRAPEGLAQAPSAKARCEIGEHFARAAHLEAASVPAFRRLARELSELGAPRSLIERARRAAKDEVRHARITARLAAKHGAKPARVMHQPFRKRSAEEIAHENAIEGCVHETFGAAMAQWQASCATDAEIRACFVAIAEDEADHAELAWDVARWLDSKLDAEERKRVANARRDAVHALSQQFTRSEVAAQAELGLPSSHDAERLFAALSQELWTS